MPPPSLLNSSSLISRKRVRSDLSVSDDEHGNYDTDNEQQNNSSNVDANPYWPRFIVLDPKEDGKYLTKLSPFAVAKTIQGKYGTVKQVKKMKSGALLIEATRPRQAKQILDTTSFMDIEVIASPHRSLNMSKGVIKDYQQDLRDMCESDILAELKPQGVEKVSRFILRKDGKEIITNTLFLIFNTPSPPEKLRIGYYIVNVSPYIPNPLRCFHCQRFGHSKRFCTNSIACWKCGSEGHDGEECDSETICCLNCKGDHCASSKSCPVWIQEKEIQRVKTEKSLPYGEARRIVTSSASPSHTTSYADAARSTPKKVSVECQTPGFWISDLPSLQESYRKPSVNTRSTGSSTTEQKTTTSRPSKPISSVRTGSQYQHITETHKPKSNKHTNKNEKSKIAGKDSQKEVVSTGNRFQSLDSCSEDDMDVTPVSRPGRSRSRSHGRKNISPVKYE